MCFSENRRGKIRKNYKERDYDYEENDLEHIVEGDAVEGPVDCICREEVGQVLHEESGPSDVSLGFMVASREVGIQLMVDDDGCVRVLNGLGCQLNGP